MVLVVNITPVMYSDISGESTVAIGLLVGITMYEVVMIIAVVAVASLIILEVANDFYYTKKVVNFFEKSVSNIYSSIRDSIYCAKKSKKARATDKPSYVNKGMIDKSLTAQRNARNMMNNKWGPGNWNKGPGSDYNKIVKWITRGELLKSIVNFFNDEDNIRIIYDYQIYRRSIK